MIEPNDHHADRHSFVNYCLQGISFLFFSWIYLLNKNQREKRKTFCFLFFFFFFLFFVFDFISFGSFIRYRRWSFVNLWMMEHEQMSLMYIIYVANLHLHYVVEQVELEHDKEHDWKQNDRQSNLKRKYFKTNLIPWDQISLFNFESIRTSAVFIIFSANFFNSFTARGARFLKALNNHWFFLSDDKLDFNPMNFDELTRHVIVYED